MGIKRVMGISVIVPSYNEMVQLPKTIDLLTSFLEEHFTEFEIIIVNDGSTDETNKLMNNICAIDNTKNTLIYINYDNNKGKGYAVRCGLYQAKFNLKMILDCDLSVEPKNILETLDMNKHNLASKRPFAVIGQRIQKIKQPKHRIFLGKCFRQLVKFMIGISYKDTQCPFKILYSVNRNYITKLCIDGFSYDVELIKMLKEKGIFIQLQNVEYYNDKNSKVTFWKTIRMGFDLIKISFISFKK